MAGRGFEKKRLTRKCIVLCGLVHVKKPSSNTCFYIWVKSLEIREHQDVSLGHVHDL